MIGSVTAYLVAESLLGRSMARFLIEWHSPFPASRLQPRSKLVHDSGCQRVLPIIAAFLSDNGKPGMSPRRI